MKAITLRNIPVQVQRAIRAKARSRKISINRAVLELLQERVGVLEDQKTATYDDLDALAGSWSAAEAKAFSRAVHQIRSVDPELWK